MAQMPTQDFFPCIFLKNRKLMGEDFMKRAITLFGTLILFPCILRGIGWADWKTSFLCGILVALIEEFVSLSLNVKKLTNRLQELESTVQNYHKIQNTISEIVGNLLQMFSDSNPDNDIFVDFYIKNLTTLSGKIYRSLTTKRFEIDYDMNKDDYASLSQSIFKVFKGRNTDYFFTISKSNQSDIEWFFDDKKMSGNYLKMAYTYLNEKKIQSVRRIFVFSNNKQIEEELMVLLLRLHQNSGFEVKLLPQEFFENHLNKEHLFSDFGIYGEHFVFENNGNPTNGLNLCGFNIDSDRICKYRELFMLLWESSYDVQFCDGIEKVCLDKDTSTYKFPISLVDSKMKEMSFDNINKIQLDLDLKRQD